MLSIMSGIVNYLPIFFSLLLTSLVGVYAWRHRFSPGIYTFFLVTLTEISWIVGYIFELASPSLEAKLFWDDFQFIGSLLMPIFLLIFAYEFTGQERDLPQSARWILFSLAIIFLILVFTNPLHGWVRTNNAWIVEGEPFDALLYDFTAPMWASFLASYGTYLVATSLFIRNLFKQHQLFRVQTFIILLGFIFPFVGSLPGMFGVLVFGQRDITPYTFGIANLIYAWGLFRYSLLEITPIARSAVFEYMNDIVVVLDVHARVVDINPAAISHLGLSPKRSIGVPVTELIGNQADLVGFLESPEFIRKDVRFLEEDGREQIFDALLSPLFDPHNRPIGRLFVARDISIQRKMEASLRKANEELEGRVRQRTAELERANIALEQKNAELERFTYTVSHDLKSPLVTISGYLGYVDKDISSGNLDRLKNDIHRIVSAVDKMYTLLNDLLELSRIGRVANPMEVVKFDALIAEALAMVQGRFDGITLSIQPDLPDLYGDRLRLVEVFQNLLENAAKFMGHQPDPRIEITARADSDHLVVWCVKDNGIGIAPEYHEQIFGLFNRLDPHVDGTGIGLTLAKRIVEYHNGRLWVESQLGQGASFYFTLSTGTIP